MEKIILLLATIGILTSCNHTETTASQVEQLSQYALAKRALSCELDSLHQRVTNLWDTVVVQLDTQLPADIPADERRNMLKVRNTKLIQMFMVYDSLPSHVQGLVVDAGRQDSLVGEQMRVLMDSVVWYEQHIDDLMISLEKADPELYRTTSAQVEELLADNCKQ